MRNTLLAGIIGFVFGSLLILFISDMSSTSKPVNGTVGMLMDSMASSLKGKTGDDFDRAFLSGMIAHHQGAVAMAEQANNSAKHDEIKKLSEDIISAQNIEINTMQRWQQQWGYSDAKAADTMDHAHMSH